MERDGPALRSRAGGHASGQPVHHAHGGGRRLRPLRPGARRTIPRGLCGAAAPNSAARPAGSRPPEPERSAGEFQHGVPGHPRERRRQWREPPARGGEPAPLCPAFPALASSRSPGRPRHERRPHADLGLGRRRRSLDGSLRQRPLARDDGNAGAGHPPHLRRPALEISQRRQPDVRGIRARATGQAAGRRRRGARGGGRGETPLRPERVDARLCASLRHLQATQHAAARSGAAAATA